MSEPLAAICNEVSGKYRIEVLESPLLVDLRNLASLGDASGYEKRLVELVKKHKQELEATAVPVFDSGWHPNLILDVGLDRICQTESYGLFQEASLGTGTTPTVYDPGSITASASGTACSASSPFFTVAMEGMLIHWDSGEEAYIQTYNSSTNVTLKTSTTASGNFAVFAVNRTSLSSLSVAKINTNAPTRTLSSVTNTQAKTWLFDVEVSNKVYTEGAIRYTNSGAYWSIFLISGGSVTVQIGQRARLSYSLETTITSTPVAGTWTMSAYDTGAPGGWDNVDGDGQVCTLAGVGSDTSNVGYSLPPGTAGSGNDIGAISSRSTLFTYLSDGSAVSTDGVIGTVRGTAVSYTNGNFYRDSTYLFPSGTYNTTTIRSFVIGAQSNFGGGHYAMWQFLFDTAKTLDVVHSVSFTFRRSIHRTLTNP